jgi:uncharacterized YigZ family protein
MQTVNKIFSATYEVKKSTFHAFLTPYLEFESTLELLKKEHPKARHIVWAYRRLNEYAQIVENQTDDGEPKGTSGPPVLNVLRGADLVEVSALVVRYFGGIKLGTGGLVRAYSSAINSAIAQADLIKFEQKDPLNFFTPYNLVQRIEYIIQKNGFEVLSRDFKANGVDWKLLLSKPQASDFKRVAQGLELEGLIWL